MQKKELFKKMKEYFMVSSIEEVAIKLGYKKTTASTWRSRGISKAAITKFHLIKSNDSINQIPEQLNSIPIPHFDNIVASAGAGAHNEDETMSLISFDKQFLKSKLGIANHKNLHTISASGDSMQPTINNGDLLFILPFENENNTIKDGAIYVLNCDSSLFVKRIRTNPIKKTLTLVSDNKNYEHIVFKGDELDMCKIVGRVTFYMGIL